jgi:hypothetical protein
MALKLTEEAARDDMTDREIAKILGGLIGSLVQMAEVKDVRNAVRWWAQKDEAWAPFFEVERAMEAVVAKYGEEKLEQVYQEGRKARHDGKKSDECGYDDPVLAGYWQQGYGLSS